MQPIPEAVAWAERADAWAQQSEAEPGGEVVPSRWSEVAAPSRTTFPEDGVGWHTETAAWHAAEQSPGNGTQPDGNSFRPRFTETAPPWQPSGVARPAWQQYAAEPAPWDPASSTPLPHTAPPAGQAGMPVPGQPMSSREQTARIDPDQTRASRWQADAPGTGFDDGRHPVREDDRARWRQDAASQGDAPVAGRRRADETRSRSFGGTGWSTRSDTDNWAGHTDTGGMETFDGTAGWYARSEAPSWRGEQNGTPGWHGHDAYEWAGEDQSPGSARRRWDGDATGTPGDGPADDWHRDPRVEAAPADPWAHSSADTGLTPRSWQPPEVGTGGRRSGGSAIGRARPSNPNRRRDAAARPVETSARSGDAASRMDRRMEPEGPLDPEFWRLTPSSHTEGANWSEDQTSDWRRGVADDDRPIAGDALTEVRRRIEPGAWQRAERGQTGRDNTSYREGNAGEWPGDLAAESRGPADGESGRSSAHDFAPFRPVGSASVPVAASMSVPPPTGITPAGADDSTREPWEDAADNAWTARQPTTYRSTSGSYERSPAGGLAGAPARSSNLLEPDEDEIEEDTGGPLAAVGYTVIWYGVPVVLFVVYTLLNGSQQEHALRTLAGAAPQFALSMLLSMVVAVGLRLASGSWKAASVGLAAAVVGGGLATVLSSAITGNSLS